MMLRTRDSISGTADCKEGLGCWMFRGDSHPVATAKSLPLLGSVIITACMHSPISLIPATCSTSGVSSKPLKLVRCAAVGPTGLTRGTMCTARPLEAVYAEVVVKGAGAVNDSGAVRPGSVMLMVAPAAALVTTGVPESDDDRGSAHAGTNWGLSNASVCFRAES